MPYRIDTRDVDAQALERLIDLGALDVEASADGRVAALLPDSIDPQDAAHVLNVRDLTVSPAIGRDASSVWQLSPRPLQIGRLRLVSADHEAGGAVVRLADSGAFGTGLHPTTALCLEALDTLVGTSPPAAMLDVGTGSGVLALAALQLGVPHVVAIDVDDEALRASAVNAELNGLRERLRIGRGGPETISGTWPLVVANVLAAPLIEMAPVLVRRVGHHGCLVLSGVPMSVSAEVERAYTRFGMRRTSVLTRGGWVALVLRATW